CAASGRTPTRTYELLARRRGDEPALFQRLRVIKLDEWEGLAMDDPGSCELHLRRHLLDPLEVPPERYTGFRGDAIAPEAECAHIAGVLEERGPIGLCVLGLGV